MKSFLAAAALTGIVAATVPAAAATAADPPLSLPTPSSGTQSDRGWGKATAPDQALRPGCRSYKFSYRVESPTQEWMAEIFLVAPGGKRLAYVTYESAAQRSRADSSWNVCRPNTTPGEHTLKMKVTTYRDGQSYARWVKPTHFDLR